MPLSMAQNNKIYAIFEILKYFNPLKYNRINAPLYYMNAQLQDQTNQLILLY
jgi:hypothetical protein